MSLLGADEKADGEIEADEEEGAREDAEEGEDDDDEEDEEDDDGRTDAKGSMDGNAQNAFPRTEQIGMRCESPPLCIQVRMRDQQRSIDPVPV